MQTAKLGPNRTIRTQDRFPIRQKYDKYNGFRTYDYPAWDDVWTCLARFYNEVNGHSKVAILLGKENCTMAASPFAFVDNDATEFVKVNIAIPGIRLYGEGSHLVIVWA